MHSSYAPYNSRHGSGGKGEIEWVNEATLLMIPNAAHNK